MNKKLLGSAALDFVITAGTAFLSLPPEVEISTRSVVTILVGAAIATAKGIKTYYTTHPEKKKKEQS